MVLDTAPPRTDGRQQSTASRCQSKASVVSSTAELLPADSKEEQQQLEAVYGKISRIMVPLFVAAITLNHIDRANLSFAALTMNRDLGFGPKVYGLGSALFFPTFCFFQIPSNLIMVRVGVRYWLSFLLLGWGVVASCFALIHNNTSFYVLRLLLGVLESGASPAMWFQLSQFFPYERLIKPYSYMSMGILIANVLGAPLAAGLLAMDGLGGLRGWQWLFLLEGIPSVLLSFVMFWLLPETPDDARWLSESQKALLAADMAKAAESSPPREAIPRNPIKLMKMVLSNPLIAYMCVAGFLLSTAAYTYIFWLPIIINALLRGTALTQAAATTKPGSMQGLLPVLLTSIPYTFGAITTYIAAYSSQKRQELFWHCSINLMLAGIIFAVFPVMAGASIAAGFASLVLTVGGAAAANGLGVTIVSEITKGPSQVVGMPFYNSISVLGGFVGPYLTGAIVANTGGFTNVAIIMGVCIFCCGLMVAGVKFLLKCRDRKSCRHRATANDGGESGHGGKDRSDSGSSTPNAAATAAAASDFAAHSAASSSVLLSPIKLTPTTATATAAAGAGAGSRLHGDQH